MELLEREAELAALDETMAAARAGGGGVLLVDGPAGIGKTAILEHARRRAAACGLEVRLARGGALEGELAYGVVRQLLEPPVRAATEAQRAALFAGAARLAAPVVLPEANAPTADEAADQRAAIVHGLYWLTANLAGQAPLLLAVDDAQWSDAASLRFLAHLARRLEGLPIAVLAAVRTGEPGAEAEALAELAAGPAVRVLHPAPLSERAVAELARARLAGEPEPEFVAACRQATGGVPFLVEELLGGLSSGGVAPSAAGAAAVGRLTSSTVGHATLLRLSRLSPAATGVAQCVAVLGRHADVRRVARLGGLDGEVVLLTADILVAAGVLAPGQPMAFAHPIVRASVYDAMPAGRRSLAHASAARMLAAEGAGAEQVAVHLMATEPGGMGELAGHLRAAADAALRRGAPESAVSHLRRALAEVEGTGDRARLLFDLGCAELVVRDPAAVAHLEEAHRLAGDPALRAAVVAQLAPTLAFLGRWNRVGDLVRAAVAELGEDQLRLVVDLETPWAAFAGFEPDLAGDYSRRRPELGELAVAAGPAGRPLAFLLAALDVFRGEGLDAVAASVERALDGGRFLAETGADSWTLMLGGLALVLVERLDTAGTLAEDMLEDARRRGNVFGFAAASALRAFVHTQRGDLVSGEADLRAGLDVAQAHGLVARTVGQLFDCIDILLERPQVADLAGLAESTELEPALLAAAPGATLLEARGRLRLLRGERDAGIADLRRCGATFESLRWRNPMDSRWRSALALALPATERAEAARLAAEELALARATGFARPVGVALRTAGLVEGGERGLELLGESLAVLQGSPAVLELARTQVALGAALRRANRRGAARDPLRAGLDLAHRCGAERLALRAEEELRAIGARPRRRAVSGVDALTPSEARVARQAARGMGNREIAQALFVTAKTVENQLSVVYQKLGIRGREELAAVLDEGPPAG